MHQQYDNMSPHGPLGVESTVLWVEALPTEQPRLYFLLGLVCGFT